MPIPYRTSKTDTNFLRLKEIADEILFSDIDHPSLQASVGQLYSVFSSITGLTDDGDCHEDAGETLLAQGRAISPRLAARCILDPVRTAQFLRATHAAILEAQKRFPNQTLEILYAGCGPFAPLAIPLTTQFNAAEIQFTVLDIHQRSLDSVQKIVQTLGLNAFMRAYIQCDATTYKHPANALHILVTETMQSALLNEPQVSIAMSLAPQICEGGILIPERIMIDACLWDLEYRPRAAPSDDNGLDASGPASLEAIPRIGLGRIAEITLENCRRLSQKVSPTDSSEESSILSALVEVPLNIDENFYLTLLTTITVFGKFALGEYESLITYPIVISDLGKMRGEMKIEFYYQFGARPGFKWRLVGNRRPGDETA